MREGILFMLHIGYAIGHVTVEPQNAAVLAGEMMSMECRTDEESRVRKWDLLITNRTSINVYLHGNSSPYHPEFTHFDARVNSHGSGILYTNSTRKDDAGLYICVVRVGPEGKGIQVSAQLIVFESQPICETNLTSNKNNSLVIGEYIWMGCSVVFRGFWMPTMEWSQQGGIGKMRRVIHNVGVVRLPNKSVTSTLIVVVDSSMKDVFFSCKTYFTEYDEKHVNMTARNVPNFSYIWNSEAVELPNYPVSGTVTEGKGEMVSSIDWRLMVAGLVVFLIMLVLLAAVLCTYYKEKIFGRTQPRPDIVPHESPNIRGNSYAIYADLTEEQPVQRNATQREELPQAREIHREHFPVYAEVKKVKKPKASNVNYQTAAGVATEIRQSKTFIGSDGTQYTAVNAIRDTNPRAPVRHPPMFSLVETYASIDHTASVLPPPLPARHRDKFDILI